MLPNKTIDRRRPACSGGFTLAELIVASTLISLVMASVYFAFNTSIRTWRGGESSLRTYQEARIALGILARDLGCVLRGSEPLFKGDENELEFCALTPPMNVEQEETPRVMWLHYRLAGDPKANTSILVREEAPVEGPVGAGRENEGTVDDSRIKKGPTTKFELASDVIKFELRYLHRPPDRRRSSGERRSPPTWQEPVMRKDNRAGKGLPDALQIELTQKDDNSRTGRVIFTNWIAFGYLGNSRGNDQ